MIASVPSKEDQMIYILIIPAAIVYAGIIISACAEIRRLF